MYDNIHRINTHRESNFSPGGRRAAQLIWAIGGLLFRSAVQALCSTISSFWNNNKNNIEHTLTHTLSCFICCQSGVLLCPVAFTALVSLTHQLAQAARPVCLALIKTSRRHRAAFPADFYLHPALLVLSSSVFTHPLRALWICVKHAARAFTRFTLECLSRAAPDWVKPHWALHCLVSRPTNSSEYLQFA